jgi:hypothetical protein
MPGVFAPGGSFPFTDMALGSVPPHPWRQSQDRVEESQPFWQWHREHVSPVGQVEVKFGQPAAPVTAKQIRRKAAAGRAESLLAEGFEPIVFDNLSRGNRWAVKWGPLALTCSSS